MSSDPANMRCHVCNAPTIDEVDGYAAFRRITSDCKPWPAGGRLGACRACGCIQNAIDAAWQDDVRRIYADYAVYHQSGGVEQAVFEQGSGQASRRSHRLVERLLARAQLPAHGRLLDFGCGNGAFLEAFNAVIPGWTLAGAELSDKYQSIVESLEGVQALYTCPPEQIPGNFDLIVAMHALEHIPEPTGFLARLREKLDPDGRLVVEVPDHLQNPFDLVIADHCTHFTAATLAALVRSAGFCVDSVATDWMPKELTLLARRGEAGLPGSPSPAAESGAASAARSLAWLQSVVVTARTVAAAGNFGLFGTSIAATWLDSELQGAVEFFVDEDPSRVGKTHLGRPIRHPREVAAGSRVFVALPFPLATAVKARLDSGSRGGSYHAPPPVPSIPKNR